MIGLAVAGVAGIMLTAVVAIVALYRQQVNYLLHAQRLEASWAVERRSLLDRVQHPQVVQAPERYTPAKEPQEPSENVREPTERTSWPHEDLEELALVGQVIADGDPPIKRKHVPEEEARALQAQLAHTALNGDDPEAGTEEE